MIPDFQLFTEFFERCSSQTMDNSSNPRNSKMADDILLDEVSDILLSDLY